MKFHGNSWNFFMEMVFLTSFFLALSSLDSSLESRLGHAREGPENLFERLAAEDDVFVGAESERRPRRLAPRSAPQRSALLRRLEGGRHAMPPQTAAAGGGLETCWAAEANPLALAKKASKIAIKRCCY